MKIMKFGGSSVADAERIRGVREIVTRAIADEPIVLVLSAMKGVTNALIAAAHLAERGNAGWQTALNELSELHVRAARELLIEGRRESVVATIRKWLGELRDLLHGVELIRECSARTLDLVVSFGERLNCYTVAAYFDQEGLPAQMVDAREMIVTDDNHGGAQVDFAESYQRIVARLHRVGGIPVVTGYIAATPEGVTTTLGRNGSDYTASIMGAAVGATAIEIWTDVDGVLSADPRSVPDAFVIPDISLQEAMELSYFGAEVIHPYTMLPAIEKNIPLWIKNTLNPAARGTCIRQDVPPTQRDITGIASISNVALINVEGGGMIGIPGIASRVFGALAKASVNIIMISQASSEHSICICIRDAQLPAAVQSLKRELAAELASRRIDQFEQFTNLEIVAVIGASMRGRPGIAGRLFSALGAAEINVLAIAQGSSEMNISFVVAREQRTTALQAVHNAFFVTGAAG